MDQHRQPYIALTELLFRSGNPESALELWEHFRLADSAAASPVGFLLAEPKPGKLPSAPIRDPASPATAIITYAFGRDGVMVWVQHLGKTHSAYLQVPPQNIARAAENLIGECARPDSEISNLRADAQYLYKWLIQ